MNIKKVKKHWGYELWAEDGTQTPYAFKEIFFKADNQTSLQVHRYKIETSVVKSGLGVLLRSNDLFDIDEFLTNGMTENEITVYISNMEIIPLSEGTAVTIQPGIVHRVIATTDLTFFEVSSTELDDVIRLQDDQDRTHGRIKSEHE